jgi:hypothetical protein
LVSSNVLAADDPVVKTEGLVRPNRKTCSFGLMKFDTTAADPQVAFELIDIDGVVRETHVLKRSALRGGAL